MLKPGIHYPGRNAHRQLLGTLPGKEVYPVTSDYIHYAETPVMYVNFNPARPVGDSVRILFNGQQVGTATIQDTTGLYVYETTLEHGSLEIKSIFADNTEATQQFYCVKLYSLQKAFSELWAEWREANIHLIANQYLTPQTDGIFRGQADQQAISANFGSIIGFTQPMDWPFERYATAMAGDPATGRPGVYGAVSYGGTTKAIKDVVQAITGYTMSDQDFRLTQGVGWELNKYHLYDKDDITITKAGDLTATIYPSIAYFEIVQGLTGGQWDQYRNIDWFSAHVGVTGDPGGANVAIFPMVDPEWIMNGVRFKWDSNQGHRIGDKWTVTIPGPDLPFGDTTYVPAPGTGYKYRYSGNPALPVMDNDPTGKYNTHYFLPYNSFSYVISEEMTTSETATVIGGTRGIGQIPLPIVGTPWNWWPNSFVFSNSLTINGQTSTVSFHVTNQWLSNSGTFMFGPDIAAALQTQIRNVGTFLGYGAGWTGATVTATPSNSGYPYSQYTVTSGQPGAGDISITCNETNAYNKSFMVSDLRRSRYTSGRTSGYIIPIDLEVRVNNVLWPDNLWYAKTEANGRTTVWVNKVKYNDVVKFNYRSNLGVSYERTTNVGYLTNPVPVTVLQSKTYKAYTELLNIVHDGFEVLDESVIRQLEGSVDYLRYNWLNPWGDSATFIPSTKYWKHESVIVPAGWNKRVTTGFVVQSGSEFVYVNGQLLPPSAYVYDTPTSIQLDASLDIRENDIIQWDYRMFGDPQWSHEEVATAPSYPYTVTLQGSAPVPYGATVSINGVVLPSTDYTISGSNVIIPSADIQAGDRICVRYYTSGLNSFEDQSYTGLRQDFVFSRPIDSASVSIKVNGVRVPTNSYTMVDTKTVRLSSVVYNYLRATDTTVVSADIGVPAGYSVLVKQGPNVYTQGVHFKVDYTYGKILWLGNYIQPGSAYTASYIYFPKQILQGLVDLVKPATMRVLLQFTTTNGLVFNPYQWNGTDNPTGEVILP